MLSRYQAFVRSCCFLLLENLFHFTSIKRRTFNCCCFIVCMYRCVCVYVQARHWIWILFYWWMYKEYTDMKAIQMVLMKNNKKKIEFFCLRSVEALVMEWVNSSKITQLYIYTLNRLLPLTSHSHILTERAYACVYTLVCMLRVYARARADN